jgi:hypothetical protein
VEYFFIGKQKVVLFLKYRENGWESAASALSFSLLCVNLLLHFLSSFEPLQARAREAASKVVVTSSMDSTRSFWRTLSILRTSWRGSYRAEMIGVKRVVSVMLNGFH